MAQVLGQRDSECNLLQQQFSRFRLGLEDRSRLRATNLQSSKEERALSN
jgi:hypothetical protein